MMQTRPPAPTDAPPWLVDFLLTPPFWFKALLIFTAGVILTLVAFRVYRRDLYISLEEQRDMVLILGTVEAIAVGVVLSINVLSLGFVGDTAVGLVGGFAVVEIARRLGWLLPEPIDDEKGVVLVAWAVVALSAFAIPDFVFPHNRAYYLGMKIGVAAPALWMFVWTLLQEFGPADTLGEAIREMDAD